MVEHHRSARQSNTSSIQGKTGIWIGLEDWLDMGISQTWGLVGHRDWLAMGIGWTGIGWTWRLAGSHKLSHKVGFG